MKYGFPSNFIFFLRCKTTFNIWDNFKFGNFSFIARFPREHFIFNVLSMDGGQLTTGAYTCLMSASAADS